jgi:hypothetical protein
VIAPPSVLSDGRRYRLHRKEPIGGIAKAPARLLEVLRERKGAAPGRKIYRRRKAAPQQPRRSPRADDAVRKYALSALDGELQAVRSAGSGKPQRPAQRKRAQDRQPGRRRRARGDARALAARGGRARQSGPRRRSTALRDDRQRLVSRIGQSSRSQRDRGRSTGAKRPPRLPISLPPSSRGKAWKAILPNGRRTF